MKPLTWRVLMCVAAVPLLQSCATTKQCGAAVFLPFAAVGDTVLAPFQACGKASSSLIEAGNRHAQQAAQKRTQYENIPHATQFRLLEMQTLAAWGCYVPGYALLPCDVSTPNRWYALTQDCLSDMRDPKACTKETQQPAAPPAPQIPPPSQKPGK